MLFEDMPQKYLNPSVPWEEIEQNLNTLAPVEGGNTSTQRGIIAIAEGRKIFVKIGVDEQTKNWASKEIDAYTFLVEQGYASIPKLLSVNEDHTGFAIDALLSENSWDWSNTWNQERLDATLAAMDVLATIKPDPKYTALLKPVIIDADNGWVKLSASLEGQAYLASKLRTVSRSEIVDHLHEYTERASHYILKHDVLIHGDVRADNCAWNKNTGEVKLVDWNWLELGDQRLDFSAFLVHVHQGGFDVLADYADRLDADALHWLAGFWFECASRPIWPGGPEKLRDTQLLSGLTALSLAKAIER